MKRSYFFYILLSTLFCSTACKKDFLDVNMQKQVTRQGYVKDLVTLEHFYNGIYLLLSRDYDKGVGAAYAELVADNLKPVNSGAEALVSHYTWTQASGPEVFDETIAAESVCSDGLWRGSGYAIIRSCNYLLEEVDRYRSEDPAKADRMKGEVLAIRAMIHFKLVNIFAQAYNYSSDALHPGIPYITTSDITVSYKRETVKDVYQKIINDYTESEKLLPATVTDTRKMNSAAVKALLARTYLFQGDYINAKRIAIDLLDKYPIMTSDEGYPDAIYAYKPISETETFFQLTPINLQPPNRSRFFSYYLRRASSTLFCATYDIAELLQENPLDSRNAWVTFSSGQYIVTKFPAGVANETPAITAAETAYYPCVIRGSELALIAAEAAAKLNEEDVAKNYLDAIRQRADNTSSPVIASGSALLDSIYKERRKELCFEGLRLFDLQRWKRGIHREDVHPGFPNAKDLDYPNNKAVAPIPYTETLVAGLAPNPGY